MRSRRGLLSLISVGLLVGCVAAGPSVTDVVPSLVPSAVPTATEVVEGATIGVKPTATGERVSPLATSRAEVRPPAVESLSPSTPVEIARADLAHRLHTDVSLIETIVVTFRAPDLEVMPCLADIEECGPLFGNLNSVQWIALSVKGNDHRYVALGELVLYCEEWADPLLDSLSR
jgi:hypothetical protein